MGPIPAVAKLKSLPKGQIPERCCLRATIGRDFAAYVLSNNVARRQMTKGAIAMVVAKAYPDPEEKKGGGQKSVATTHFPMVTRDKLAHARTVLSYASELADDVISGHLSLDPGSQARPLDQSGRTSGLRAPQRAAKVPAHIGHYRGFRDAAPGELVQGDRSLMPAVARAAASSPLEAVATEVCESRGRLSAHGTARTAPTALPSASTRG